jgi:hypothetical protein
MKICFDIDEVISDWIGHFLRYVSENHHLVEGKCDKAILSADKSCAKTWNFFEDLWGLSREDFMFVYNRFCDSGQFATCPLVDPAVAHDLDILQDSLGLEFIFCTSRPPDVPWNKIYHCSSYLGQKNSDTKRLYIHPYEGVGEEKLTFIHNKADVFNLEKPDIVLDDKPEYLLEAVGAGVKHCILVRQPHNEEWMRTEGFKHPITYTAPGWKGTMQEVLSILRPGIMAELVKLGQLLEVGEVEEQV